MTKQQGLDLVASAAVHRVELGDHLASADDREVFASVFDRVEDVGEVSCGVGGAHLGHRIRLSDSGVHNVVKIGQRGRRDEVLDRCRIGDLRPFC